MAKKSKTVEQAAQQSVTEQLTALKKQNAEECAEAIRQLLDVKHCTIRPVVVIHPHYAEQKGWVVVSE